MTVISLNIFMAIKLEKISVNSSLYTVSPVNISSSNLNGPVQFIGQVPLHGLRCWQQDGRGRWSVRYFCPSKSTFCEANHCYTFSWSMFIAHAYCAIWWYYQLWKIRSGNFTSSWFLFYWKCCIKRYYIDTSLALIRTLLGLKQLNSKFKWFLVLKKNKKDRCCRRL